MKTTTIDKKIPFTYTADVHLEDGTVVSLAESGLRPSITLVPVSGEPGSVVVNEDGISGFIVAGATGSSGILTASATLPDGSSKDWPKSETFGWVGAAAPEIVGTVPAAEVAHSQVKDLANLGVELGEPVEA